MKVDHTSFCISRTELKHYCIQINKLADLKYFNDISLYYQSEEEVDDYTLQVNLWPSPYLLASH